MHTIKILGTNEDGLQKIEAELQEIGYIEINGEIIYKMNKVINSKTTGSLESGL